MEISWQSRLFAVMKENHITIIMLAKELGYCPEYVGMVLSRKREPKCAERKFSDAVNRLIGKTNDIT